MDSNGNCTDKHGRTLTVNAPVRVDEDYDYDFGGQRGGEGVVLDLGKQGTDYEGFVTVKIGDRNFRIPDSALIRTDAEEGSTVAHLEKMIATTTAANDAKRAFIERNDDK